MSQNRIELNVGGIRYSTTASTLSREPDSMLGRMFSHSWSTPTSAANLEDFQGAMSGSPNPILPSRVGNIVIELHRKKKSSEASLAEFALGSTTIPGIVDPEGNPGGYGDQTQSGSGPGDLNDDRDAIVGGGDPVDQSSPTDLIDSVQRLTMNLGGNLDEDEFGDGGVGSSGIKWIAGGSDTNLEGVAEVSSHNCPAGLRDNCDKPFNTAENRGPVFPVVCREKAPTEVFIDADGTHFRYILNYLRRGELVFLPNNVETLEELLVEANYFALAGLVRIIEAKMELLRPVSPLAGIVPGPFGLEGQWNPAPGDRVRWCPEAVEGYWRSVAVAIASFHYQTGQTGAVCGFMQKTKFLPDDMEIFFLRCVSCRASTRVGEVWRYDVECLLPIKSVMATMTMAVSPLPAHVNGRVSTDCVTVLWSSSMSLHVSKSALIPLTAS